VAWQFENILLTIKKRLIMSLIRRSGNLFPAMPIFDDFLSRELFNWGNDNHSATSTTVPSVNIRETADNYEVEVAAPGMDKKDFNITLENNLLTISSAKEKNSEQTGDKYTRREFSYQSFVRTFQLQKGVVDEDKIQAKYENGLLLLTIPKKEEVKQKPPRMIEIA
jgi:HSP20 family protein